MPSPSKLLAPLKNAIKRGGDDTHTAGSLDQPPPPEPCVVRDYVTVPKPSEDGSEFSSDTKTPAQPQSVTGLESYPPAVALQDQPPTSGASIHPLDAQSDLSSAQTARRADEMEPEEDEENQELTDEQLKRLYDDEEIERFLKHVTEVTLAPSANKEKPRKATVLRSNGQEGPLETEVISVDDSDAETDVDEPWTSLNTTDIPTEPNTAVTTPEQPPSVPEEQPLSYPHQPPKYLSARVAAWIIPKLPPVLDTPPHKFRLSSVRLAGQRLYVATYPFYAPFFADLARLAAWTEWNRSARVCTVWWILWYYNLLLPALFGKTLYALLRRRVLPNPNLKELRERRRLAREVNQLGDAMEGQGAGTSYLGTGPMPSISQTGGDMGIRDMWKLAKMVAKGKSKKGKEKVKQAGEAAAVQMGLSGVDEDEEARRRRQEDEDWRMGTVKILEDIADLHERVRNLFLWRREMSSRIYTLVLTILVLFTALVPAQLLAKITYAILGILYWFVVPVVLAMPPEARKRIPPPLFDVPTDAEYAISLMSIRVANGESVVPTTRRGGREHGRARRFIANMSMESLVGGNPGTAANSKDVEWDVASPNQSTESMRQEANEKEAVATHERLSAAGDLTAVKNEDAQYNINSPPAKTGTLGRLKNRLEESTIDLLGGNKNDSNASLQSIGAPQTVPANHKAMPGTLSLSSEGICFTPLLTSNPRLRISLERIQGVKKTSRTNGLRVRHLNEEGVEHEAVFRFVPNRDEVFGKLVGWGGKRWKKVP